MDYVSRILVFPAKYNTRKILQNVLSVKFNLRKIFLNLDSAKFYLSEKSGNIYEIRKCMAKSKQ